MNDPTLSPHTEQRGRAVYDAFRQHAPDVKIAGWDNMPPESKLMWAAVAQAAIDTLNWDVDVIAAALWRSEAPRGIEWSNLSRGTRDVLYKHAKAAIRAIRGPQRYVLVRHRLDTDGVINAMYRDECGREQIRTFRASALLPQTVAE